MNSVRDAVHPVFDPDAAQSVVQRAGAVAQIELRVQRVGQVSLGPGDSFFQRKPFGKVGRNGTGQSAARTVGVGVGDTLTRKPDLRAIREGEQIVGVGVTVAALEQDGTAASCRLGVMTSARGNSSRRRVRTASDAIKSEPEVATITGSTTMCSAL